MRKRVTKGDPVEWVGGSAPLPSMVIENGTPQRIHSLLWIELPSGIVTGHALDDGTQAGLSLATLLVEAMKSPREGQPRKPARVRVAHDEEADAIRRAVVGMDVVVAPTPELEPVIDDLYDFLETRTPDPSYLADGAIDAKTVAAMFRAATVLHAADPWRLVGDGDRFRIDAPALGANGACLVLATSAEIERTLFLVPSLDAFGEIPRLAAAGRAAFKEVPAEPFLALSFEQERELSPRRLTEIRAHGWPATAARTYPVLVKAAGDGAAWPLAAQDLELVTAAMEAVAAFCERHARALEDPSFMASESFTQGRKASLRITFPYEASAIFESDTLVRTGPSVGRNDPCQCGSGKKYKKCCLPREEAAAGQRSSERRDAEAIHDLDRRLARKVETYANDRFPGWDELLSVFADDEASSEIAFPWAVYDGRIDGRRILESFAEERGSALHADERRWLDAELAAWLSIWEIVEVSPGTGFRARDLLTGEERRITEHTASNGLRPGDGLLCRVVEHGDGAVLCGMHGYPLSATTTAGIVDRVRKKLRRKGTIDAKGLRAADIDRFLIESWERGVDVHLSELGFRAVPP